MIALKQILKRGGIKGLWKGSIPNVYRAALVNLGDLTTYDFAKRYIMQKTKLPDCHTVHIMASICAGLVAATMGTPADVVKTRIMNQPTDPAGRYITTHLIFFSQNSNLLLIFLVLGVFSIKIHWTVYNRQ